jgi:beta-aspartyl-peptidase (threonine type)
MKYWTNKEETVKNAVLILFMGVVVLGSLASALNDPGPAKEILGLLEAQAEAWNRGDFEGFMATYWKSPDMTFQSGNQRLSGWDTLLKRYQTNYAGARRGELSFKDLTTEILSEEIAYVLGRYHLEYPDTVREGVFTIILKRFPQGWRIIHDHSSSDPSQ